MDDFEIVRQYCLPKRAIVRVELVRNDLPQDHVTTVLNLHTATEALGGGFSARLYDAGGKLQQIHSKNSRQQQAEHELTCCMCEASPFLMSDLR